MLVNHIRFTNNFASLLTHLKRKRGFEHNSMFYTIKRIIFIPHFTIMNAMKTIFLFLFFLPFVLFGQAPILSVQSQFDLANLEKEAIFILRGTSTKADEFPISTLQGELYVSFIGKLREGAAESEVPDGIIIGKGSGKIRSIRVKLTELHRIQELSQIEHLELAQKIRPHLDRALYDTRADSVHLGLNLPRSFTGKNVIIGSNDWGFDYTHPMFYDTLLQNTRILAAWDQWKSAGPHPTDYGYGAEYNGAAELLAAESDTSNQLSYSTHGTHTSGIAGGSGAGVMAKGLAFEAEFLFTTLVLDEAAVLDSWYWMRDKANDFGKNLVVNMSWGLYHFGTPDGTSLMSQAINDLSDEGVLFVCSAGNNGNVNFHFEREFFNDSIRSRINFYDYALHDSMWGQSIHGWGEVGREFQVKIEVRSGSTILDETPYFSTSMNTYAESFIKINNDTIWYTITAQEAHPQNGKPTVRLRVKNENPNLSVVLVAKATEGTVHFWNLITLTTNGGNWGLPFTSLGNGFIAGDSKYGVSEPGLASACLTVASHIPSYTSHGYVLGGNRSNFSSIGPRLDGSLKPEISAPGSNILSAINSYTDNNYSTVVSTTFEGKTYDFGKFSGTSMAAPVVTGIAALIWEVNPYLSPHQVKDIIVQTARQDDKTGVIPPEGNVQWGYGKVDAMTAIQAALNFVGLQENVKSPTDWTVFPNPSNTTITVQGLEKIETVQLYDLSGKRIDLDPTKTTWTVDNYAAGVYLFRVIANQRVYQKKIVIQ